MKQIAGRIEGRVCLLASRIEGGVCLLAGRIEGGVCLSIIPSSIPWKDYPLPGDLGPTLTLCHEVKPLHQFCSHAYYPADSSSFFPIQLSSRRGVSVLLLKLSSFLGARLTESFIRRVGHFLPESVTAGKNDLSRKVLASWNENQAF